MKTDLVALALLSALAPLAHATDPPELVDLRQKYESALGSIREPIHSKYLAKLQEMLTELTRDGKLEEALLVRKSIQELETTPSGVAPTPSASTTVETTPQDGEEARPDRPDRMDRRDRDSSSVEPPANAIVLSAGDASIEGSLKIENGMIKNWLRTSCKASWQIRDVPAGKYDLFFVYSAGDGQGGVVQILDFSYNFEVKIEQTKFERDFGGFDGGFGRFGRSSSSEPSVERVKVGTIETRGGIGTKVIAKSKPEAGIMQLKEIHLVPVP